MVFQKRFQAVDGADSVRELALLLIEQIHRDSIGKMSRQQFALLAAHFVFFKLQTAPLGGKGCVCQQNRSQKRLPSDHDFEARCQAHAEHRVPSKQLHLEGGVACLVRKPFCGNNKAKMPSVAIDNA
ncbi:MAG: hypothetical protein FWD39_02890 [Clostridiales bacterium]|nr:hypothetical protein [Clostridiales bacterium]